MSENAHGWSIYVPPIASRIAIGQRYRMCGPLDRGFPTFYELESVDTALRFHASVQEEDGAIISFARISAAGLVAAIGQGWLVLVETEVAP